MKREQRLQRRFIFALRAVFSKQLPAFEKEKLEQRTKRKLPDDFTYRDMAELCIEIGTCEHAKKAAAALLRRSK